MNYPNALKGTLDRAQKEGWTDWGNREWSVVREIQIRKYADPPFWSRLKASVWFWTKGMLP